MITLTSVTSSRRDMTSSIIKIPKGTAAAGVASNTALVIVRMTVCTGVGKRLHTLSSLPIVGGPYGF